ncbi:hypothetical protein ETAA8_28530 [Anatilimnocola aggregata]|uniref:Uncharacterized protein n=1 Tax=Anatilimnocola aggregata TaxID=2528021 RepID=A0A517YBY6_9BACT|nr:hypothetical protein [Anatilimnocola aggregata]QDU27763.1 hypothetical protein ETAA8_28530 [Anatilimnocola aggregata]
MTIKQKPSKAYKRNLKKLWNKRPPDEPEPVFSDEDTTITIYEVVIPQTGKILRRMLEKRSALVSCNACNSLNFFAEPNKVAIIREREAVLCSVRKSPDVERAEAEAFLASLDSAVAKVEAAFKGRKVGAR